MVCFGMPALIELDTIEQHCALCAELGLGFVELNTNFPNQQIHLMDPHRLNSMAECYHIGYTIHLNDEMTVADFNPTVAKGYRDAVLQTIDFSKQIGAGVLNMHISEGAHYTRPDGIIYFYEAYREPYLQRIAQFRDACEAAIGQSGIRICMENSKAYLDFQKAALDVLLESPAFCLTLDIGHSHCSGYADEEWILARKDKLRHMHFHDAAGGVHDHLPLGSGQLALNRYLDLAWERECSVVLEVKTADGLRKSIRWLQEGR